MNATVDLDDDLLAKARRMTGLDETSAVVRKALEALIQRESARQLADLGGSEPRTRTTPRRRNAG